MTKSLEVCILAAGVGSRMKSDQPKVLQTLAGKPLLAHLLETVAHLKPSKMHVIIGQGADDVKAAFAHRDDINWILQTERLGTGHAMQQAAPAISPESQVLVLLGDAPMVEVETLQRLLGLPADLAVLSVEMPDPFNYGRIIRNGERVTQIVEEKDTSEAQKRITEINTGVMAADGAGLLRWLDKLDNNNAQKEFLMTDVVEHANAEGASVQAYKSEDPVEVTGINTFAQLGALERAIQYRTACSLQENGVQVMDANRLDIRGEVEHGRGVVIDINVVLAGSVSLGNDVFIGPNCVITDAVIGDGSVIKANSVIEGAVVHAGCSVGPFARLRPGAVLSDRAAIGNFVEVKKTTLGVGSKASHLTYLGDATIGDGVNIGAGTITCNYDGVNKFQTEIGDGAFIGSNSSLVAPVQVGKGATVGAGSTITKAVDDDALAIGRGRQTSLNNWQRPTKKK